MQAHLQSQFSWYAIRVRGKFERHVSVGLAGKGYEQFLPLARTRRIWSDGPKDLDLPLFSGYVFCRFDPRERILPILTTPGVVSIVSASRIPIPIPDSEIDAIKAVVLSGFVAKPWRRPAVGARVVIEKGPLSGVEGFVLELNSKHLLIVSILLLQRSVSVEIDPSCVRPLNSSAASSSCETPDRCWRSASDEL